MHTSTSKGSIGNYHTHDVPTNGIEKELHYLWQTLILLWVATMLIWLLKG